ncbi:MAG TPA: YkgJ family cysteine cluster protein [Anaerolineae bacterium]|nr:YkgJ family cysteine cluster protein [Anaerolineae bacterium]
MSEATPALNQLCLACGLCCVGVVHTRVPLAADELSLAHKLEMQVAEFEEGPGFQLPCPQYRADRCAAYQQRPQACINYQCELLQRCCEGAVTVEDALSLVAQAKRMLNQLRVRWPDRASTPLTFDRLRRLLAEP